MRPRSAYAAVLAAILLVAACTVAPPSVAPSAPSASSEPSAGASPPPVEPSAEPTDPPDSGPPPPAAVGHSIECTDDETTCEIHSVQDGVEPAGWPVVVEGPCRELRSDWDGRAYVGCSTTAGAVIHALDLAGQPVAGWPKRLDGSIAVVSWYDASIGCGVDRSAIAIAIDGGVYVAIAGRSAADLHVFERDGSLRPGWPQAIPGDPPAADGFGGDGCRGFDIGDDGTVVAWGYEGVDEGIQLASERTEFMSWSGDGRGRSGWPIGATGAATGPILDADGGITFVTAAGRAWSFDAAGQARPGWPYELDAITPPVGGPDGRVAFVNQGFDATDELVLLGRDGRPIGGGPIQLQRHVETRCVFGDVPCAGLAFPAFAADSTIYLALGSERANGGGALLAIDPSGQVVPGWPVELAARTHILDLRVDADGTIVAGGIVCDPESCSSDGTSSIVLTLAPDGTVLEERPGS